SPPGWSPPPDGALPPGPHRVGHLLTCRQDRWALPTSQTVLGTAAAPLRPDRRAARALALLHRGPRAPRSPGECASATARCPRPLRTIKQAAQRVNVCPGTVYDLCARRKLRPLRIGGSGRGTIRIAEADLEAFLQSAAVQPDEPATPRPPSAQGRGASGF